MLDNVKREKKKNEVEKVCYGGEFAQWKHGCELTDLYHLAYQGTDLQWQ